MRGGVVRAHTQARSARWQGLGARYGRVGVAGRCGSLRPCRFWEVLMTAVTVPAPLPLPGPPDPPAAPADLSGFLEGPVLAGVRALPPGPPPGLAPPVPRVLIEEGAPAR